MDETVIRPRLRQSHGCTFFLDGGWAGEAEPLVCAPTSTLRVIPASAHAANTNEVLRLLETEKPGVIKLIFMIYLV